MSTKPTNGCDKCNPSDLAFLLLRPSLLAKDARLAPTGADRVADADALVNGLVPGRRLTESRTVLRLLRPGFVHVYLESPPPGVKNWLVYRVSDAADCIPQTDPVFSQTPAPPACARLGHNKTGMKLIRLPQAHKVASFWIAFSANLWNDNTRKKNAANPKAMRKINLHSCDAHSFKPTADSLKASVLECALDKIRVAAGSVGKGLVDQDQQFQFNTLADQVDNLVDNLQRAAALHPETVGLELAIVIADPVGLAAEANALRLRRNELAKQEFDKPEVAHPYNSSNAMMGLKRVMLDANMLDSYAQVSPIRSKAAFDASTDLKPGTEWTPLTEEDRKALLMASSGSVWLKPYQQAFSRPDLGRVTYADHDERAAAWAAQKTEETWKSMTPHYDESARAQWVQAFDQRMKAEHYEPIARFEADWRAAADDSATVDCFLLYFDPEDPNDPLQFHSPGLTYAVECHFIHTPAPLTNGAVLDDYLAMLDKTITDESAVVQRALLGNQRDLIALVHGTLTGTPGLDADQGGGMRDKTYDFLKGLREEVGPLKKYSWLGEGIARLSVSQTSAITGAAMAWAMQTKPGVAAAEQAMHWLGRAQDFWGIQQALEWYVGGALGPNKQAAKVPVLIAMKVDAREALEILRARPGQNLGASRTRIKRQARSGGRIALSFLTDTDSLKAAKGDLGALITDPSSGQVGMKGKGTAMAGATAGSAVALTEQQFLDLWGKQSRASSGASKAVRDAMAQASADFKSLALTLDGRLAIGSVIVQGLGLIYGFKALEKANATNDIKGIRDAWYGIYDSTAGTVGGLLEMYAVTASARVAANSGAAAVGKSLSIGFLRAGVNVAGAAGGIVNMYAMFMKREDALSVGDHSVAIWYRVSGVSFGLTAGTSLLVAGGAIADTLVARGIGGAAVEAIAVALGAEGVAILGLSLTGWGLLLLGAAVTTQVIAVALTPTELQRWAERSYFGRDGRLLSFSGKRDDMYAKGDWKAEFEGLQTALKTSAAPPKPAEKAVAPAAAAGAAGAARP